MGGTMLHEAPIYPRNLHGCGTGRAGSLSGCVRVEPDTDTGTGTGTGTFTDTDTDTDTGRKGRGGDGATGSR